MSCCRNAQRDEITRIFQCQPKKQLAQMKILPNGHRAQEHHKMPPLLVHCTVLAKQKLCNEKFLPKTTKISALAISHGFHIMPLQNRPTPFAIDSSFPGVPYRYRASSRIVVRPIKVSQHVQRASLLYRHHTHLCFQTETYHQDY